MIVTGKFHLRSHKEVESLEYNFPMLGKLQQLKHQSFSKCQTEHALKDLVAMYWHEKIGHNGPENSFLMTGTSRRSYTSFKVVKNQFRMLTH